jgi:unsaturated rhamnogalacturonyl hydrolase
MQIGPACSYFTLPYSKKLVTQLNYLTTTFYMKKYLILLVSFLAVAPLCSAQKSLIQSTGLEIACKVADSEMKHFPELWAVDFNTNPVWNYTQGLIAMAMVQVADASGNLKYYDYAKTYADKFISPDGTISHYELSDYNIDAVNSGKFLFNLYLKTSDERYLNAIKTLREQLKTHPRTLEGGFWHKKRYPYQMWLDGLYMGAPFYAQYAKYFKEPNLIHDIVDQFVFVHQHTYHAATGLNYHGWDERKFQKWADPNTGCSPHFWSRAEGWYAMALVDVLDYLPNDHSGRAKVLSILNQVAAGIKKHQDPKTGLWYQVTDQGGRKGNYLEATSSSMFAYALLKAVRLGYISKDYKAIGVKAYQGILTNLIKENGDGTLSLTQCCSVAGLGGNPYRDGSYEYYISEPVRDNDPKGVGPFIMAALEYNKK